MFLIPGLAVVAVASVAMGWPDGPRLWWMLMPGLVLCFGAVRGELPRGATMGGGAMTFVMMGMQANASLRSGHDQLLPIGIIAVSALVVFLASFTLPKDVKPPPAA